MKKIHFNQLTVKNWTAVIVLITSAFIIISTFGIIDIADNKTTRILAFICFIVQAVYLSKIFWYKNYVEWNKLVMNIKINRLFPKSVKFENVKKLELKNNLLMIVQKSGDSKTIDINGIPISDLQILLNIIKQNSGIEIPEFTTSCI